MKNWRIKDRIDDSSFIQVCELSNSMSEGASTLGLHFNSFKKRAIELGCYQAGVGIRKRMPQISLEDIIEENLYPHYQTFKLKQSLLAEGIKCNECETCGIST